MDLYLQIADDINKGISNILRKALTGIEEKYRYEKQYIRWGLVESDIHAHVVKCLTGEKE